MIGTAEISAEIALLGTLDLEGLRAYWARRYGAPLALRSVPILRMLIAWRIQANEFGGLDAPTKRILARKGAVRAEGLNLGIGARLVRQWKGREVEVVVQVDGFSWNGQVFPSLSAAATAIAGTRWNGPRFFGLREEA